MIWSQQFQTVDGQEELRSSRDTIRRLNEEVALLNTKAESHAEAASHLEKLKNEVLSYLVFNPLVQLTVASLFIFNI